MGVAMMNRIMMALKVVLIMETVVIKLMEFKRSETGELEIHWLRLM